LRGSPKLLFKQRSCSIFCLAGVVSVVSLSITLRYEGIHRSKISQSVSVIVSAGVLKRRLICDVDSDSDHPKKYLEKSTQTCFYIAGT
jgi:hypothetical protein